MGEKGNDVHSKDATDVQQFIEDLDAGVFMMKVGRALSDVAAGVVDHGSSRNGVVGTVSLEFKMKQVGGGAQVLIAHKLSYTRPTAKGDRGENNTTATPMYVGTGGRISLMPGKDTPASDMFNKD